MAPKNTYSQLPLDNLDKGRRQKTHHASQHGQVLRPPVTVPFVMLFALCFVGIIVGFTVPFALHVIPDLVVTSGSSASSSSSVATTVTSDVTSTIPSSTTTSSTIVSSMTPSVTPSITPAMIAGVNYTSNEFSQDNQTYVDVLGGNNAPSQVPGDGWTFVNTVNGQKINWYFFSNMNSSNPTQILDPTATWGNFNTFWTRLVFHYVNIPHFFFIFYSAPQYDGCDNAGWYRSRKLVRVLANATIIQDIEYLFYAGSDPVDSYMGLEHIDTETNLFVGPKSPCSTQTDFDANEVMLYLTLQTAQGSPVGNVNITSYAVGYGFNNVYKEISLSIAPM